ncbi:MAG TPA: hypothetical protein VMV86_04765 [Methanosarcinales archaeon]|nr:hypothetical protein [Methanosarcinales archaeon]
MDQAKKATCETRAILIDSEIFPDLTYAIDREGKGMWLIIGDKITPIDYPTEFIKEMKEVWEHVGVK